MCVCVCVVCCVLFPSHHLSSVTTEALGATSDEAYSYINSALHFLAQPAAKDPGNLTQHLNTTLTCLYLRMGASDVCVMALSL